MKTLLQYLLPQHLLSSVVGLLANCRQPWLKNFFINWFIKKYQVNMTEALEESVAAYATFNEFFTRRLKSNLRQLDAAAHAIVSPVDGRIAQIGLIEQDRLFQAKNFYFTLTGLLGGDSALADYYRDGLFTTLYLAPHDYHRIHMPIAGKLLKTIYVPGRLFSVNQLTANRVSNLYARNERLICVFHTEVGEVAVILVGALIVGSMQTTWMTQPIRSKQICIENFANGQYLEKGAELGCFKLGSTVILLFAKQQITWINALKAGDLVQYGQIIGTQARDFLSLS